MDLIKKNWEKILLGAVLVGLLVAVVLLPIKIATEKAAIDELIVSIIERPAKAIEDVDLSAGQKALERTSQIISVDLTTGHRLFNPVLWQRATDGRPIKVQEGNEIGVGAVQITQLTPLYLVLTLDSVLTTDSGSRYAIGVEKQADPLKKNRLKRQTYAAVGDNNDTFVLKEVVGPPAEPTAVVLELSDTGERVTLKKDEEFRRVDGYAADLAYPPENRNYAGKRLGDPVPIARETYNIVAITKTDVVLSAPSGKKTTLTLPSAAGGKP
jgi:hypothetical protein